MSEGGFGYGPRPVAESAAVGESVDSVDSAASGETAEDEQEFGFDDEAESTVESTVEDQSSDPADPQEWIEQLIWNLRQAEYGIGAGPRDVLAARVKLAQAYVELTDPAAAAPLAVENAAQAEELYPASEEMLARLREFRDRACEAAGWSAASVVRHEPVTAPAPDSNTEPDVVDDTQPTVDPALIPEATAREATAPEAIAEAAEKVHPAAWPTPPAQDARDCAELIRLRLELAEARRTIARLRHRNVKLTEALDDEPAEPAG